MNALSIPGGRSHPFWPVVWLLWKILGRLPRPGRFALGFTTPCLIIVAIACGGSSQPAVIQADTNLMARQLSQYRTAQPSRFYLWSADIAALNAIQDARAQGRTTYSVMMNRGQPDPIWECPSRGYPVPGDTQLTNPDQVINGNYNGTSGYWAITIPQIDPAGGYTSHATSSTYPLCIAPNGQTYTPYFESDVNTFPFPVTWNYTLHRAEADPNAVASFTVPFDQAKANQTPMEIVFDSDGSASLRNSSGTIIPLAPAGTPQATPSR